MNTNPLGRWTDQQSAVMQRLVDQIFSPAPARKDSASDAPTPSPDNAGPGCSTHGYMRNQDGAGWHCPHCGKAVNV